MNVRTLVWLAVPLAVAAVAPPASAAARPARPKARTSATPYKTAGGVSQVISGVTYVNGEAYGAALVQTRRGDQSVAVTVADDHSAAVAFELAQDADGDGQVESHLGEFCGRTTSPVRLAKAGAELIVYVLAGTCGSTGVSTPTTGTVTTTIYGR